MRTCLDIQAAVHQRAGVGRYTQCLAENLARIAPPGTLSMSYFDLGGRRPSPLPGFEPTAVCRWFPRRLAQAGWSRLDWPPFDWFSGPADLFHFPNFILPPLTRGKSVVTIHDLSFLAHPETTEERNLRFLTARIGRTVAEVDAVITNSHFTARELRERLGVPETSIFPIHLGVSPAFWAPPAPEVAATLARLGIEEPYLLHVGTIEPRKNLPFLVDVFEKLAFPGSLVLAGQNGWKFEPTLARIQESPARDRIRHLGFPGEDDLPALYAGAQAFVFPSLYEGFGLPPLEAMACGTPVVAAATGSLPEVLGDAAVLVEGFTTDAWTESIQGVLADVDRRDAMRARGAEHAARFRWEDTARHTWDVYQRLLGS